MEFEFDKEIHALLRQTAKGESAFVAKNPHPTHLDADEISAFAENVLPNKARIRVIKHLAECDSCRISLSNLIVLNSEAETETASSAVSTSDEEISAAPVSWFDKLFGFKNLAYGLGTLVLLFAGFTAFILIQNFSNSSSELAQIENTSPNVFEKSSENSNSASDVSADEMANTASDMNLSESDSDQMEENQVANTELSDRKEPTILNEQEMSADDKPKILRRNDDNIGLLKTEPAATPTAEGYVSKPAPPPMIADKSPAESGKDITIDEADAEEVSENEKAERKQPITTRGKNKSAGNKENRVESKKDADDVALSSGGKQVGGKTFKQTDSGWVDTAYRNQKTTKMKRGTSEYIKLDSGLRSIADELGGTVVIVWKSKAYKIQ